ncbi:hypothetical protein D3C71_1598960 [compost metagenome]
MKLSLENRKMLVMKVFKATKRGLPMDIGFEWASKKLVGVEMNIVQVRNYWYDSMHDRYRDKLAFYKKGISISKSNGGQWSKKDDDKIIMLVKESYITGKSLEQMFIKLGESLDRTQKAVSVRWYNVLSKKKSVILDMEAFKNELEKTA